MEIKKINEFKTALGLTGDQRSVAVQLSESCDAPIIVRLFQALHKLGITHVGSLSTERLINLVSDGTRWILCFTGAFDKVNLQRTDFSESPRILPRKVVELERLVKRYHVDEQEAVLIIRCASTEDARDLQRLIGQPLMNGYKWMVVTKLGERDPETLEVIEQPQVIELIEQPQVRMFFELNRGIAGSPDTVSLTYTCGDTNARYTAQQPMIEHSAPFMLRTLEALYQDREGLKLPIIDGYEGAYDSYRDTVAYGCACVDVDVLRQLSGLADYESEDSNTNVESVVFYNGHTVAISQIDEVIAAIDGRDQ